jgi:hypothetical protein
MSRRIRRISGDWLGVVRVVYRRLATTGAAHRDASISAGRYAAILGSPVGTTRTGAPKVCSSPPKAWRGSRSGVGAHAAALDGTLPP